MTEARQSVTDSLALEEQQLLAGLRLRDERAFEQFESMVATQMYATARRMLRDDADAQDAVQEAFIGAYKSIANFDGRSKLSTWMTRIVINKCLMRLRSKRRSHEVSVETLLPRFKDDGHPVEWTSHWRDEEPGDSRERTASLVRAMIDELPDHYRAVLVLRDVQGLSTEETAEALGDSPNAVKVRLHRARQALRTLLDPHMRRERVKDSE
ncbi:MAG TPA: sigma-70 family RNA polymerase sigma factor [Phycisphaerales bacterium]|nr:sigma-70 family RNA polymerase sigma factor [Phycisphaerales bacterium]